jgi:hypothetical protein
MAIDPAAPRTRRAVLAAALGGVAATALHALGRPQPVAAADGDPVLAGQAVTATAATSVANTADGTALLAVSGVDAVTPAAKIGVYGYANQDANARAIYGKSLLGTGVWGNSDTGRGLFGRSTGGTGVSAQSDTGRAVFGTTGAVDKTAILGQNTNGGSAGVQGFAGSSLAPTPEPQTGVEGVSNLSTNANGVHGESSIGTGVWGETTDGLGVAGTGTGINSVGVFASGGIGLYVDGPAFFTASGKKTISSGSSTTIAVPGGLGSGSIALAVLQTNRTGVWVRAITQNLTNGTITVYLNTSVTSSTVIGWFVIN